MGGAVYDEWGNPGDFEALAGNDDDSGDCLVIDDFGFRGRLSESAADDAKYGKLEGRDQAASADVAGVGRKGVGC